MKKHFFLLVLSCLVSFGSFAQNDQTSSFKGLKRIIVDNQRIFTVNFLTEELSDTDLADDTLSLTSAETPLPANSATVTYHSIKDEISALQHNLYYFSDVVTIDSITQTVIRDKEHITVGHFKNNAVSGFKASSKIFAGKVELSWQQYPDADGYIIIRSTGNQQFSPDADFQAFHVIESGITTSWTDTDVLNYSSFNYYILAFNATDEENKFVSAPAFTSGSTQQMRFLSYQGNEEITSLWWSYDNSIVGARELEAIAERIVNTSSGNEVYKKDIFISDFNIGDPRLNFHTVDVVGNNDLEGVNVTIPTASGAFTYEFWLNVGQLGAPLERLLSDDINQSWIGISKNQIGLKLMGNAVQAIDHTFKSNAWTHFGFSSNGSTVKVIIDGVKIGEWASPQYFPSQFGIADNLSNSPFGVSTSQRLGFVRLWNINRSADQLNQDRYDIYNEAVANLKNQWLIPEGLNQTTTGGLLSSGNLVINKTSNYTGALKGSKAYIFDQRQISQIFKYPTAEKNQVFDILVNERGSGKKILSSNAVTNSSDKKIPNELHTNYVKADLSKVEIEFMTGSVLPKSYQLNRVDYLGNKEELASFEPKKINRAATFDGSNHLDLTSHIDQTGDDQTYNFLIRASEKELSSDVTLIDLGGVTIDATKESQLEVKIANHLPVFLTTVKNDKWRSIGLTTTNHLADTSILSVYLDGILIDTAHVNALNIDKLEVSGSSDRTFQLAYAAFMAGQADEAGQFVENYKLTPNIFDGWSLLYHNQEGNLIKSYFDGNAELINLRNLVVGQRESNNQASLENYFLNKGAIISAFKFTDFYNKTSFNRLHDSLTYSYQVVPEYIFTNQGENHKVAREVELIDLKFNLENLANEKVQLSWSLDTLNAFQYDSVAVYRNSSLLGYTYKKDHWIDSTMAFGEKHVYEIRPIKNNKPYLSSIDSINMAANGLARGLLLTAQGDFIIPATSFELNKNGEESISALTDAHGIFNLQQVSYGLKSKFVGKNKVEGSFELSKEFPVKEDIFLKKKITYQSTRVSNLLDASKIKVDNDSLDQLIFHLVKTTYFSNSNADFYVNVYINQELKKVLVNELSFRDEFSKAESNHYRFVLYYFNEDKKVTFDSYELGDIANSSILPVQKAGVTLNNTKYVPQLNWSYPNSDRVDGFRVWSINTTTADSTWIANVGIKHVQEGDSAQYQLFDRLGASSENYDYFIAPYAEDDKGEDILFSDVTLNIGQLTYPDWTNTAIYELTFTGSEFSTIELTIKGGRTLEDLPFDGFHIENNKKIIAARTKDFYQVENGNQYTYKFHISQYATESLQPSIHIYKVVNGEQIKQLYYSAESVIQTTTADLSNLSKIEEGKAEAMQFINVEWDAPSVAPEFYTIFIDNSDTPFDTIIGTSINYAAAMNQFEGVSNSSKKVKIYASHLNKGLLEKGNKVAEVNYSFGNNKADTIAAPSNVKASLNGVGRIALSWEFPAFALADFEIFRDGKPIATLETYHRSYIDQDENLIPGKFYTYQIRSKYKTEHSPYFNTVGRMLYPLVLQGEVIDLDGKPVRFAQVRVANVSVFTDSTGFYQLPLQQFAGDETIDVNVSYFTHNGGLTASVNSKQITVDKHGTFRLDFRINESLNILVNNTKSLAGIQSVKYYEDNYNHQVILRWSAESAQFSHYDIYQNGKKLSSVQHGVSLEFIDENAIPGYAVNYEIVPVTTTASGEEFEHHYADAQLSNVLLDNLKTVEFLQATAFEVEGLVKLDWVHERSNATGYIVQRNIAGELKTAEQSFVDSDGTPGEDYKYVVKPYFERNGSLYFPDTGNDEVFIQYPSVAQAKNLIAEVGANPYEIKLSWDHPENAEGVTGYKIEREDDEIAVVNYPAKEYVDAKGFPNTLTVYRLSTLKTLDDDSTVYTSKAITDTIWYSAIQPIEELRFTNKTDTLEVDWSYNPSGADYFKINVTQQTNDGEFDYIVPVSEASNYKLQLLNFHPSAPLNIKAKAVKNINDEEYYSAEIDTVHSFSDLPSLNILSAQNVADSMYNKLYWTFDSHNIDSIEVLVNGKEKFMLQPGARSFTYPLKLADVVDKIGTTGQTQTTFRLTIHKIIDGELFEEEIDPVTLIQDYGRINTVLKTCSMTIYNQTITYTCPETQTVLKKYRAVKINAADNAENEVRISWSIADPASITNIDRWKIFRSGVLIAELPFNAVEANYEYFDNGAFAGQTYLYQVRGYDASDVEQTYLIPDLGSKQAKAKVLAVTYTSVGASPISGVPYTLKGELDNGDGYFISRGITDESGQLELVNLPYKKKNSALINFTFAPDLPLEYFDGEATFDFTLGNEDQLRVLPNIWYNKAYTVKANTQYNCKACGIDSVKLRLETFTQPDYSANSLKEGKTLVTNEQGQANFSVPPASNLYYRLTIDRGDDSNPVYSIDDKHFFASDSVEFDASAFQQNGVFEYDFTDLNTVPLQLNIVNTCGESLGDYEFRVRVTDFDGGSYDSTFYTSINGELDVEVPPYNLAVKVTGVRQADAFSALVVDYFSSRVFNKYYKEEFTYNLENNAELNNTLGINTSAYDKLLTYATSPLRVEFQQTPEIFTNDFDSKDPSCSNYLVLDGGAGEEHTVRFAVTDNGCSVNQGYILVKNPGAKKPFEFNGGITSLTEDDLEDLVSISELSNDFEYTFTASKPNMVAPYTHLVEVFYFDDNLILRASENYEYIVTGSKLIEGNDVFIDPAESYLGEFQVPFLVLRDPPGDHSYSYLEAGQEFSMTLKTTKEFSAKGSIGYVNSYEAFIVTNDNSDWAIEYQDNSSNIQTINFKSKDKISTAKTSVLSTNIQGYLDGPEADVISGAGIAYKYGLTDVLSLEDCGVRKSQRYDLVADEIKTTWTYTRSMIKQTIKYYDSLLNGSGNISNVDFSLNNITARDGEIINQAGSGFDPLDFINNAKVNWENLLNHVDIVANPVCKIIESYDEILLGYDTHESAANAIANSLKRMTKDEGNVFVDDTDGVINSIKADMITYLDDIAALKTYVNGLGTDVCVDISPLSLEEWTQESFNLYGKAYEGLVKFNIVTDYVNQLATIQNYSSVDNLEVLSGDPLNPANLISGIASASFLAKNIKTNVNKAAGQAFKNGVITAMGDDFINSVDKILIQSGKITDADLTTVKIIKSLNDQSGLTAKGKALLRKYDKAFKSASNKYFTQLFKNGAIPEAAEQAGKQASKRVAREIIEEASKKASKSLALKAALKSFGKGIGKFGAGFLVNAALVAGHTLVGTRSYNFLREYYVKDLSQIDELSDKALAEITGYVPQENITFSGGTTITKTITSSSSETNSYEGYWGSYLDSEMEIGIGYEGDIWGGIAAGTEASVGDGKLAAKIKFNDKIAQKINSSNSLKNEITIGYELSDNDDGDHFNLQVLNYAKGESEGQLGYYFHIIGGRSSSPYEEGTISRDMPTISFQDEDGNKYPTIMTDLDPTVSKLIPVMFTSGNKFQEGRSVAVTIVPNSNNNGAQLLLSNAELFVGRSNNYFIPAGENVYTNLLVDAKTGIYDYNDLALVIRPLDVKDDFFADDPSVFDTINFQMNYRKPVSNVAISTHDGPWHIRSISEDRTAENYIFYLKNYDVEAQYSSLSYIEVQYKRAGEGQFDWETIKRYKLPEGQSTPVLDTLDIDELYEYYQDNIRTYNEPVFPFEWNVTGENIVDGDYLVRAKAYDQNGLFSYSNVYQGRIDRVGPSVVDKPAPRDGVYSIDDQVFVEFDERFDANYFDQMGSARIEILNGQDSVIRTINRSTVNNSGFNVTSSDQVINFNLGTLPTDFDGENARIIVKGIQDMVGNPVEVAGDSIVWSFKLDNFLKSPSPIKLDGPDNWIVNSNNFSQLDTLTFGISGYDVYQTFSSIDKVYLEVNEANSGVWHAVDTLTVDELLAQHDSSSVASNPTTDMYWYLNDSSFLASDGSYKVRASLFSNTLEVNRSNVVNGVIDRVTPKLEGIPAPADEILSKGEFAQFRFTEAIDINNDLIEVNVTSGAEAVDSTQYDVSFSSAAINIVFTEDFMKNNISGDSIHVTINGVFDLAGNAAESIHSQFKLDYYQIAASQISIENTDNWLINADGNNSLPIIISDYDLYGTVSYLDSIAVEYKYLGNAGNAWNRITTLSRNELIQRFEVNNPGSVAPIDTIYWDTYWLADGQYEIRAIAKGGSSFNISNHISGRIDRTYPTVLGKPQPINHILTINDVAQVSFSEAINYFDLGVDMLDQRTMIYTANDTLGYSDYDLSLSSSSIEIIFTDEVKSLMDGDTLYVKIDGIADKAGNPLAGDLNWYFRIENQIQGPSSAAITVPQSFVVNFDNRLDDLAFTVEAFDVNEFYSVLDEMYLQVKRSEQNEADWINVDTLTKEQLLANYAALQSTDPSSSYPIDYLYLDPTKSYITDGNYVVRVAIKGDNKFAYSNQVSGFIDRKKPVVSSVSPADGVFSRNDDVSIGFSEAIDISTEDSINVEITYIEANNKQTANQLFDIIWSSSRLVLNPLTDLAAYDGKTFTVAVSQITDLVGNALNGDAYEFNFLVDYYRTPVSPVSIKAPSSFIVNQANKTEPIQFILDDFELNVANFALDSIQLEVKLASVNDWVTINSFYVEDLLMNNAGTTTPQAYFSWFVTDEFADGNYHVRAIAFGESQFKYSNQISGVVDRQAPQLTSVDPTDRVFSRNDKIQFSFNETLRTDQLVQVNLFDSAGVSINDLFAVNQSGSSISIIPLSDLLAYSGSHITVSLNNIYDFYGNSYQGDITESIQIDYVSLPTTPAQIQTTNNFVINSSSDSIKNIYVDGYDLFEINYSLDSLVLEVRASDEADIWQAVTSKSKSALLAEHNDPNKLPATNFTWNVSVLNDGVYELRVKAFGNQQFAYSNTIGGRIDRTAPTLAFEPLDGIYSKNDALGFTSNEAININQSLNFSITTSTGQDITTLFNNSVSDGGLNIWPKVYNSLVAYSGQILSLNLLNTPKDLAGNAYEGDLTYQFELDFQYSNISLFDVIDPTGDISVNKEANKDLMFVIKDYQLNTDYQLDSVELLTSSPLNPDQLIVRDRLLRADLNVSASANPNQDTLRWEINANDADGVYELHFRSYGGGNFNTVHTSKLLLDRLAPELENVSPADGIYSRGGEISFSFNEELNESSAINIAISSSSEDNLNDLFDVVRGGAKITLIPNSDLAQLDGERISVIISAIADKVGNTVDSEISQEFVIDYYKTVPSPVQIKSDDNFVHTLSNSAILNVEVDGYDVYQVNYVLDSLALSYRMNENSNWIIAGTKTVEELLTEHPGGDNLPETSFQFNTENLSQGNYEIRVTSYGGNNEVHSNIISGVIDRVRPEVLGLPNPGDKTLSYSETVSFSFTEAFIQDSVEVQIYNVVTNEIVAAQITSTSDQIEAILDEAVFRNTSFDSLRIVVEGVSDIYGNQILQNPEWTFIVDQSSLELTEVELLNDGWIINQEDTDNKLVVEFTGFDLLTQFADSVVVQFRKEGEENWNSIGAVTASELKALQLSSNQPIASVDWDVSAVEDAHYTIRAVVHGLEGRSNFSNEINGVIDRMAPSVLSFAPGDTTFTFGDEISLDFSERISCTNAAEYTVLIADDNNTSAYAGLEIVCTEGSKILFMPDIASLHRNIGKSIIITVDGLSDYYGNKMEEPYTFSFIIGDFFLETSPISIIGENREIVVNQTVESIPLTIGGYDFANNNYALDSVDLYFSKTFENDWKWIDGASIQTLRNSYLNTGKTTFAFEWLFKENNLSDGFYMVKAVAYGNGGIVRNSEPLFIELDTEGPELTNIQLKADQLELTFDEELSVLDQSVSYEIKQMFNNFFSQPNARSTGVSYDALLTYSTISNRYYGVEIDSNKVTIAVDSLMKSEFGNFKTGLQLSGVKDRNGNLYQGTIDYQMVLQSENDLLGTNLSGDYNADGNVDLYWLYSGVVEAKQIVLERFTVDKFDSVATFYPDEKQQKFFHTDLFNFNTAVFYRLKMVGDNDQSTYSRIILVEVNPALAKGRKPLATVYPNPTENRRQIKFRLLTQNFEDNIKVDIYNSEGLFLKSQIIKAEDITQTHFQIDFINELSSGMYLLKASQGDDTELMRVILK